jgi:hypothetical protein
MSFADTIEIAYGSKRSEALRWEPTPISKWLLDVEIPGGSSHGHGANGLRYTLCMDPSTHRPVSITIGSGGMVTTYSDWNKPIQIDAPKME